jgi:hypothetical protein
MIYEKSFKRINNRHLANKSFKISPNFKYLWKTQKFQSLPTHIEATLSKNFKVFILMPFLSKRQAAEK